MSQRVVVSGQVKVAKKAKTPPLAAVPPANPKPKTKFFFFFQAEHLLNPRMVWIAL